MAFGDLPPRRATFDPVRHHERPIHLVVMFTTTNPDPSKVKGEIAGVLRTHFGPNILVAENAYKHPNKGKRIEPIGSTGKNLDDVPEPSEQTMIGKKT